MRKIDTTAARDFAESGDRYTGAEVRVWVHDLCDNLDDERAKANAFHMAYRLKCDEETKAQAVEIERLRAELAALRKDVQRYHWLRKQEPETEGIWVAMGVPYSPAGVSSWNGNPLDAAIDAAIGNLTPVRLADAP